MGAHVLVMLFYVCLKIPKIIEKDKVTDATWEIVISFTVTLQLETVSESGSPASL